jgi:protoporphyrinogen oxidase
MVWLWSKLTMRRQISGEEAREEKLGYPRGSWETLLRRLQESIETGGGRVLIDRPAASIEREGAAIRVTPSAPGSFRAGHDPREFATEGGSKLYPRVIATVPTDLFDGLLGPVLRAEIGEDYLRRAASIEYHTALCLLLEVDRPVTDYYWTNIADPGLPFLGLVEHTNFVPPERYDGRRFLYVANYLEPSDPLLELDTDQLLDLYEPGLRRVNPNFAREWVRQAWLFQEPAAQPIVTVGYQERMPPLRTGARGLVLANTTQIYPEDRGTNYAVRLGDRAVEALLSPH